MRLRLAAHIHFALLRHYGEDVGVSALLKDGAEVREALWVCAASGRAELVSLALQLARIDPRADGAQPGAARATPAGWLNPASWLRRGAAR